MWKYLSIYQIITCLTFVIAFWSSLRFKKFTALHFLVVFVFITEVIIINYLGNTNVNNYLANNVYTLLLIPIYAIFFIKSGYQLLLLVPWFFIASYSVIFTNISNQVLFLPYIIGMLGIMILIFVYANESINSMDKPFRDYKLYLGTGILLFIMCSFPMLINGELLLLDEKNYLAYFHLLTAGNFLLNIGYLIALIVQCQNRKYIVSSSPPS